MVEILFLLIAGHFLADYPLQGDFLARGKNRTDPIPGVPFYQCLIAHAFIHGGVVAILTGSWILGAVEVILHAIIDDAKCTSKIGFNTDQALHIGCKVIYAFLLLPFI